MMTACWTLGMSYRAGLAREWASRPPGAGDVVTEQALRALPPPVQRYLRACGIVGRPLALRARIVWRDMLLRSAPERRWLKLKSEQLIVIDPPTRAAYMSCRLGGVIPFEGLDTLRDGHSLMQVRLLKVLPLAQSHGRYMDESALVTLLAELMFVPALALQRSVAWEPIDDRTASARLTHRGVTVSGTFHFNEANELVCFHSDDRYRDGKPPERLPWSAEVASYARGAQLSFPREVSATWHEPARDFTYVRGIVESVELAR